MFADYASILRIDVTGKRPFDPKPVLSRDLGESSWEELEAGEAREFWDQIHFQVPDMKGVDLEPLKELAAQAREAREEILADPERTEAEKRDFLELVDRFLAALPEEEPSEEERETLDLPTSWDELRSPETLYRFFGHVDWKRIEKELDRRRAELEVTYGFRGLEPLTPEEKAQAKRDMEEAVTRFRREVLDALSIGKPAARLEELLARVSS